jgi:DNA-binding NarL/FixJ family response regulator
MARVISLVTDLMDRSRIGAALDDVTFVRSLAGVTLGDFDVVIIDLERSADAVASARAECADLRIVGFAPHVDDDTLHRARSAGADLVLPRSKFFRDVGFATFGTPTDR